MTTSPSTPTLLSVDPKQTFVRDVQPVLEEVRLALTAVVGAIKPAVSTATQLQRATGVDNHLGWHMFNAANTSDAFAVVPLLPGPRALQRFLNGARKSGVSDSVAERAVQAVERFEQLVRQHAGTRELFESMVSSLAPSDVSAESDRRNKRAAFRALSSLVGRHVRAQLDCHVLYSGVWDGAANGGPSGGGSEAVFVDGTIGWCQTRADVVHRIEHRMNVLGSVRPLLENAGGNCPPSFLPQFCSQLPELEQSEETTDARWYRFRPSILGVQGEISHFSAQRITPPETAPGMSEQHLAGRFSRGYLVPCELGIMDLFVHERMWDRVHPRVGVYAYSPGNVLSGPMPETGLLPLRETASLLGNGWRAAPIPEIPQYEDVLRFVFATTGWPAEEFLHFRVRVEYPIISSRVVVRFGPDPVSLPPVAKSARTSG